MKNLWFRCDNRLESHLIIKKRKIHRGERRRKPVKEKRDHFQNKKFIKKLK